MVVIKTNRISSILLCLNLVPRTRVPSGQRQQTEPKDYSPKYQLQNYFHYGVQVVNLWNCFCRIPAQHSIFDT